MASAARTLKFQAEVAATRDEATRRASRRVESRELFASLWAPLTALGAFLLVYIIIVELDTAAVAWAQPVMRLIGSLCFVWWVGLIIARLVMPGRKVRRLRHEYRELSQHIENGLRKAKGRVDPETRSRLVGQARVFEAASVASDAPMMERELESLSALASKTLPGWKDSSALEFILGLIKWLAIALLIRAVVFEPFKIPSGSMIPTLQIGDQIFVNKFIYGVRLPFINVVPFQIVRAPRAGDVIVFNNPVDPSRDFIKRVIGVGGDTITIQDEVLYINGEAQPRELIEKEHLVNDQDAFTGQWSESREALYRETLKGHVHSTLQRSAEPARGMFGPLTVPPGHVFVMGDNRDNSADSRFGLGDISRGVQYVPLGNIKGKAMVIWLALGHDGIGSSLFGGTGLRVDRLFNPVR